MINVKVKKQYNKSTVLDFEYNFEEGKKYALIGTNGSGKSTLLKILDNQIKATDGKPEFTDGIDNIDLCYMTQSNYAFDMSLKSNVMLAIPSKTLFDKTRWYYKTRANKLIYELGLSDLKKKNATKLSGGETQRMALARCLVVEHKILLLDEPTAALDVSATATAEKIIQDYYLEYKPTIIFATHSLKQAERLADVVIFLKHGKIIEIADAKTFISNPQTEELKEFLQNS